MLLGGIFQECSVLRGIETVTTSVPSTSVRGEVCTPDGPPRRQCALASPAVTYRQPRADRTPTTVKGVACV